MIQIDDKFIDEDIFKESFACNLNACKGACCVEGDCGAPLDPEECEILEKIYPEIKPYLTDQSKKIINKKGTYVRGYDGELETPLVHGAECAYVVFENGFALCAIEKAYNDGKISFRKPISCHLYPIRIEKNQIPGIDVLRYDRWDICNAACKKGLEEKIKVFEFCKNAIIRKYGEEFYDELASLSSHLI